MKVLLVHGPSQDPSDRFFGWPTSLMYAAGPAYIDSITGEADIDFSPGLFDPGWYVEGLNSEAVLRSARSAAASVDVVCASATNDSLYPTLRLLEAIKTSSPNTTTILGGAVADESLSRPPAWCESAVDFLVSGDGDYVLRALLRGLASPRADWRAMVAAAPGSATVRHRDEEVEASGVPLRFDLVPPLQLGLLGEAHSGRVDIGEGFPDATRTAQMIAARGCPYSCWYCSERRQLATPAARTIDSILSEIELRKNQGFDAVFFDDSTFGAYPRLSDLLQALGGMGMSYGCLNRFDRCLDHRLVERYARAGFRYFYCAVEQFDDRSLRVLSKGQTKASCAEALRVIGDSGIRVGVSLLFGVGGESEGAISDTLDFVADQVLRGPVTVVSQSVLAFHSGVHPLNGRELRYDVPAPNQGYPFDQFEEGQWYHHEHVTADYLDWIIRESKRLFGNVLVRERHSWRLNSDDSHARCESRILATSKAPTVQTSRCWSGP